MAPKGNGQSPFDSAGPVRPDGAAATTASGSSIPSGSGALPPFGAPTFAVGELLASRFRILRFIASGGMGEVYEAEDEELHDRVALKTIRPEIARDEQALKRFRREVLLARKVTHPSVCRTFDVFRHRRVSSADPLITVDEVVFVTMELLSGETLAERIRRAGRLSTSEALPIVTQMAAALTAAHAVGVVHRDLKSSNVMLLPSPDARQPPRVVVSDFGLAHGSVGAETTISETVTRVLGTPAYMAPEQIEGGPITPAVDIYALGIVMFEMVTGARPFVADTPFSTALKRLYEPPPSARGLVPDLDPNWDAAILRCLERAPANRFSNAADVVAALADGSGARPLSGTTTPAPVPNRVLRIWRRPRILAAAGVSIVALAAAAAWMFTDSGSTNAPGGGQLVLLVSSERRAYDPAISPDGRMIAYIAEDAEGRPDLFVADTRGEGRVQLTNDDAREQNPQVSPDGSRVVFTRVAHDATAAEIWSVPLLGGQLAPLVRAAASPAWSPDGTRLAFVHLEPDGALVLATANADGSELRTLLAADSGYLNVRAPAWSPDGQEIAFIRGRGGATGELWIVPVAGGAPRRLSNDPAAVFSDDPAFTSDGNGIVHSSNRGGATNIWLMPRSGGMPSRVTTGPGPDEMPSIARDGTLVFGSSRWRNILLTHDLSTGLSQTLFTHSRFLWAPAFSPDGRELAFSQGEVDGSWHIWVAPLSGGGAPRRLTSTEQGEIYPRFTPDGAFVLFHNWNAPSHIWRVPRAGGPPSLLPIAQNPGDTYADVSPDGAGVAFVRPDPDGEHVYVAPAAGGSARRLVPGPASVPRWSPDGEWIALAPDRSHSGGVFVVRADGTGMRRMSERGGWPIWWPDGSQIAYLATGTDGNQIVEVVPFEGGTPRRLDSLRYTESSYNNPIAISPDGKLLATTNGSHVSDEIWLLQPDRN